MRKKYLIAMFSLIFIVGFTYEADAQRGKKKRGTKERPSTEQESSSNSGSQRSNRGKETNDDIWVFSRDKLVFDILGDFRIGSNFNNPFIKIGLKPGISYKVLDRVSFGVAPKIEYYFTNIVNGEDFNEFDLGLEFFGRVMIFDIIYLQAGYDINNYIFYTNERDWFNSPVIGAGYMTGFGQWRYGAQALFLLNEKRRDYSAGQFLPIELWFGFTYNL